jgi:signal peptide peptidase SppA
MKVLDILNAPWAILPEKYLQIRDIYYWHLIGEHANIAAIEAQLGKPLVNEPKAYTVNSGVAIVSIHGIIAKRMDMFMEMSGGVSTQTVARNFLVALADPEAHSILLSIDSPGGEVDGTHELAQTIFRSRGVKPIVALADGTMASAAYWIGAAADKIFIAGKTTQVGSIGVVSTHIDRSERDKMMGLKYTEITAGQYKRTVSWHKPLDRAGEDLLQSDVDQIYSVFVDEIAEFRGTSVEKVLSDMADGRIFIGQKAIDAGLADGFATEGEIVQMLNARAEAEKSMRSLDRAAVARLEELQIKLKGGRS